MSVNAGPTPRNNVTTPPVMEVRVRSVLSVPLDAEFDAKPAWGPEFQIEGLIVDGISMGTDGEMSTCDLHLELGSGITPSFAAIAPEDVNQEVGIWPGDVVRIVERIPAQGVDDPEWETEWFRGHVGMDSIIVQGSPQVEGFTLTAYGPELRLSGVVVTGAWYPAEPSDFKAIREGLGIVRGRSDIFGTNHPVIFNQDGLPNADPVLATVSNVEGATVGGHTFSSSDRRVIVDDEVRLVAINWTASTALRSLVDWYDNGQVISTERANWDSIDATLGDTPIAEVDVEGMSLLGAMRAVLEPVGFGFTLRPWGETDKADARYQLQVFSQTPTTEERASRSYGPLLPPRGDTITTGLGGRGEVQRLHRVRDNHNVRNDVTVLGDPKRVGVTLVYAGVSEISQLFPGNLIARWDVTENPIPIGADGDLISTTVSERETMLKRYHPDGEDFHRYRHVWRSFVLNEDGSYSQFANILFNEPILGIVPQEVGIDRPNPEKPGTTTNNAARIARPVGDQLVFDDESESNLRPPEVWLVVDNARVRIPARVWRDRAGFTITAPLFTMQEEEMVAWAPFKNSPVSEDNNALRDVSYLQMLRNTITDQEGTKLRLELVGSMASDTYVSGVAPFERDSTWPLLAQRVIRVGNRFRKFVVNGDPDGTADAVDDTAEILEYARKVHNATEDQLVHGSITLRSLSRQYLPGLAIWSTRAPGRVIDMQVEAGGIEARPVRVKGVRWRLTGAPTTELLLDSTLVAIT